MTFNEIVKRIAEEYREEARRTNFATVGEYLRDICWYGGKEVKEEIYFCLTHDLPQADAYDFDRKSGLFVYDDCSFEFWNGEKCEEVPYRKLSKAIRAYAV